MRTLFFVHEFLDLFRVERNIMKVANVEMLLNASDSGIVVAHEGREGGRVQQGLCRHTTIDRSVGQTQAHANDVRIE